MSKPSSNTIVIDAQQVLQEKMGSYSKYIIQDRALPDVRDGLKPVQRRILYAMYQLNLMADRPKVKCARIVGETMGKYHPHGDSSIYEALVVQSQTWKNNIPLIDFQGNNGSIDGLGAAAMRYTEARLSKFAQEILSRLDKNTIDFVSTFDETNQEPTILPTLLPLTLINGISGIAIGFATDIPPFNILELLEATKAILTNKKISTQELQKIIPAPDLPLGGVIVSPRENIIEYYQTGEGKLTLNATYEYNPSKNEIIFNSIPYGVSKSTILKQLEDLVIDGKLFLVKEIFDDSTKSSIKIKVRLEKQATSKNVESIVQQIFKLTKLSINLSPKNVVIVPEDQKSSPKTLSLKSLLEQYINHSLTIILREAQFDFKKAQTRKEIVEGLIKAHSIIDELIALIKASKGKADAKEKMIQKWSFSDIQAEAILTMQLHRLSNTDIVALEKELKNLIKELARLEKLIKSQSNREKQFIQIIDQYLIDFEDYKRKTQVVYEKFDLKNASEPATSSSAKTFITITKQGWIYNFLEKTPITFQKGDSSLFEFEIENSKTLIALSNHGNILPFKVSKIPQNSKSNPTPTSIFSLLKVSNANEQIIFAITNDYSKYYNLFIGTRRGVVKSTRLDLITSAQRATKLIDLAPRDSIVDAFLIADKDMSTTEIFSVSKSKMLLSYLADAVAPTGLKTKGIISHKIKSEDYITWFFPNKDLSRKNIIFPKRVKLSKITRTKFPTAKRAQVGKLIS